MEVFTIGQRAAHAIRERCVQERTRLYVQLEKLGVSNVIFWRWEKGNFSPNAYFLKSMALDGYDIYWILTGGEDGKR
jgi:hypothetical protein